MVLPVLLVVLGFGVWALACVSAQLRCTDAAALGARAAARGDPPAAVEQTARSAAPGGAQVEVRQEGDLVRVVVSATVRPLGSRLGAMAVTGRGVALREDTAGEP